MMKTVQFRPEVIDMPVAKQNQIVPLGAVSTLQGQLSPAIPRANSQLTLGSTKSVETIDRVIKVTQAADRFMTDDYKVSLGRKVRFIWTIYRLGDIDCVASKFEVDMRFVFEWDDAGAWIDSDPDDLCKLWRPRIIVVNKTEDTVVVTDPSKDLKVHKSGQLRMKWHVTGRLQELYELNDFPFDAQDLHVCLRSKDDFHALGEFVPGIKRRTNSYQNVPIVGWNQFQHQALCTLSDQDVSTRGYQYATLVLALIVQRKYMYYVWAVYMMIFLLTACGFSIFQLDCKEELGDRVGNNITLLLTMVSYKFAMNESIPKLEYFTYMDQYIYLGFGMIIVIVIETVFVKKWLDAYDDDDLEVDEESDGEAVEPGAALRMIRDFEIYFAYTWLFLWVLITLVTWMHGKMLIRYNYPGKPLAITNQKVKDFVHSRPLKRIMFGKKYGNDYMGKFYFRYQCDNTEKRK